LEKEIIIEMKFFDAAAEVAKKSLCLRDKCGAVIILNGRVIGTGYNAPPGDNLANQKCRYDFPVEYRRKPKSDCTCCRHAEVRAIQDALWSGVKDFDGSVMYFTRIDENGKKKFSGEPYCIVCSGDALDNGIGYWALLHDYGPTLYDAQDYNNLSFQFHEQQKSLE
jgi:deoxycytidylate deaminase